MLGLILTAAVISVASAQTCFYKNICADHTMCKYPPAGFGKNCWLPKCAGLSFSNQQQIVDLHNNFRRRVACGFEGLGAPGPQPPAANLRQIKWDDELAAIAQRWANRCTLQPDTCRNVAQFYVGQNMYISSTNGVNRDCTDDWASAVQAWYDEVRNFDNRHISPFQFTSGTSTYTQVVWADTYKVGCGFTAFLGIDGSYKKLYVCNYGPGGNIIGGSMYKTGAAGSQCPAAAPENRYGLCC